VGQVTACGLLNADALRRKPPLTITQELLPEHWADACAACKRGEAFAALRQSEDDNCVAQWQGYIRRYLKSKHARAKKRDIQALAERLASVGFPHDPDALDFWEHLRLLLLTPMVAKDRTGKRRMVLKGLSSSLKQLPPNSQALTQVAAAMRAWRRVMGRGNLGHVDSGKVVANMLSVPEPEAYILHLRERGFTTLSSVFSAGVLERAKEAPELRGMWGGSDDYWQRTADQLNVIE
jgi:hypothetical protein